MLGVWSTGLVLHPVLALKRNKFITWAKAVKEDGGWRKGFNLQNKIYEREMADSSPKQ